MNKINRNIPINRTTIRYLRGIDYFSQLPKSSCNRHKFGDHFNDIVFKAALFAEVTLADDVEDLVDGRVGRKCAVEDAELTFEPLGDVITSPTRLDHGSQELGKK